MLIAGLSAKKREWIFFAILYALPTIAIFALIGPSEEGNAGPVKEDSWAENVIFGAFFLGWVLSIIHIFMIRRKYLYLISYQQSQNYYHRQHSPRFNTPPANNPATPPNQNNYLSILEQAKQIRTEIYNKIKKSSHFDSFIIDDIKPLVDKYIDQVGELIERDKKIYATLQGSSEKSIHKSISHLQSKVEQTSNPQLTDEYLSTIKRYEKHLDTIQEFRDQREMIKLRLNSTIMSLKQVKYDLIKMEQLSTDEQRKQFFNAFEEKSKDLSNYLKVLEETYSDSSLK